MKEVSDSLAKRKPKPAQAVLEELAGFMLSEEDSVRIRDAVTLLAKYKMKEAKEIIDGIIGE